jgi:SAM-dependent methyltransferase
MPEASQSAANAAQIEYWNALAGETWVKFHAQLDRQIAPLGHRAQAALAATPGEAILDIGCGCGQTSLELAAAVGPTGSVTGVDISHPMLDVARAEARATGIANTTFDEADAQTYAFAPARYDGVFSRFGVMFFADPVAAFANIRTALKPAGRLAFVCWRPFAENLWMRVPMDAARDLLPPMAPADPLAPGPFAFADPDRVRQILTDAGYDGVKITPFDAMIGGGDLEQTLELSLRVGPLGAVLRENPDYAIKAIAAVRAALAGHVTPAGVMMPSAVWIVEARAG